MHKPFGLIRTRYMKENKGNRLTLTEIKQVELGILDYIVDICNKYNLIYYLSYGTLIGAIRHKGFIPWDDDIDISMPRNDYEKFLKITSSGQINSKYKCLVPLVDGYYYEFAKVIDTSTIVEDVSVQSTENGVWVDIFPLDGLNKSDKISHLSLMILNRCRAASVNNHFPHKTSGVLLPIEYVFWKVCRLIGFKAFLKKALNCLENINTLIVSMLDMLLHTRHITNICLKNGLIKLFLLNLKAVSMQHQYSTMNI